MYSFSNPVQTQKVFFFFFITQSEKHTSAKFVRFKSSYKVYILGFPAAVVWEVPWGHWVFWTWSLFINIFTEEKYQKRQRETTTCLFPLQSVLVSRSHNDWHRCQSFHLSVCLPNQLVYKSVRFCFTDWRVCWEKKTTHQSSLDW